MWKYIVCLVILAGCNEYTFGHYKHSVHACEPKVMKITDDMEREAPTCDYRSKVETIQNGKHFIVLCRCPTEVVQ